MTLQTMEDLLVHQIQDILSAEHQVKRALPGMAEAEGYLDDDEGNRDVLDAGIRTAAQRFEHYEIAAYGSAITFARQLNRNEVASLLQESLDEETAADEKLTSIAENGVNDAAMKEGSRWVRSVSTVLPLETTAARPRLG